MTDTPWPNAGTYAVAARDVETFFVDDRLREGQLRTSPLGVPLGATGRNAVVFRITTGHETYAVRCFTNPPSEGHRRYEGLRAHVEDNPVAAIAAAEWMDEAVSVSGRLLPMIQMEWVEGRNLDAYIREHVLDADRMRALADAWTPLLEQLEAAEIAHSDLQHGNVLVESDGTLRLVDLDAIWTPMTAGFTPSEVGHVNYQHPQRIAEGYWSPSVDAFASLSIALSLEAVCQQPELWDQYHDGANNLLLTAADYLEPGTTPLWQAMDALTDPVPQLLGRLSRACNDDVADLAMPVALLAIDAGWWAQFGSSQDRKLPNGDRGDDGGGDGDPSAKELAPWIFVLLVTLVAIVVLVGGVAVVGTVQVP